MTHFRYAGQDVDGHYVHGEIEAANKKEAALRLLEQSILMIVCHDVNEPELLPHEMPLSLEEPAVVKPVEIVPEPAPVIDPIPPSSTIPGPLGFIINHSHGAVRTRLQALGVLCLIVLMLGGTLLNAYRSLIPRPAPKVVLPPLKSGKLRA